MVQTVRSEKILVGHKKIIFEKPQVLRRIFISIDELASTDQWCESRLSFDDPMFYSYFVLKGSNTYLESKGEGIFQGDIWVRNQTNTSIGYTATEILI